MQDQQDNRDSPGGAFERGPLRGLTANVLLLGGVSFLADISTEMLYPLLPLFLTGVLGAPVSAVGLIEGLAEATASLAKPLAGVWSDRGGQQRRFILGGYGLSALAKGLLALAGTWPLALFARMADRLGKGLRSAPRDALLAESAAPAQRGKAFGLHRGMDTLGAVAGPLLALGLLQAQPGDLRRVLWLAVIPGLLGAALTLLVRSPRRGPAPAPQAGAGPAANGTAAAAPVALTLTPRFRSFLIAWGVFSLANSSDVFLLLRAKQLGCAVTTVVLLYALYNLAYALASPWLGHLSDRLGRRLVLLAGLLAFALIYGGFALAGAQLQLTVLFCAYGLYMAATEGVSKAYALDLLGPGAKGAASGLLGLVGGLGALAASAAAGLLWQHVAPWSVFALGGLGSAAAAVLLLRMGRGDSGPAPGGGPAAY